MTTDRAVETLAFDKMQIRQFAALAAWKAPWEKSWLSLGMLERRWSIDEIEKMIADDAKSYQGLPAITFPTRGWLKDLLDKTAPGFMESAFLATELMHIADGMSEDLRVASGLKKSDDVENRELVEPLYRESIENFSLYLPSGLSDSDLTAYQKQRDNVVRQLEMALSAHMLLSGRSAETQIASLLSGGPISNFAFVLDRVFQSVGENTKEELNFLAAVENIDAIDSADTPDGNVKELICTANDDFLAHRPRSAILEKYARALSLLELKERDDDEALARAARQYSETHYSAPVVGGLFFAADKTLSLRDYRLARIYILLDEKVRALEADQQYGFSKYLTEFMHNFTLAKALMQLDRIDEAEKIVSEWATSAQTYETPQDTTGRTLGSLLVSRVMALYSLLLDLGDKGSSSSKWWQMVLDRPECFSVMCELCADRLEVDDSISVQRILKMLSDKNLVEQRTGDVIFFWWLLSQVKSVDAEAALDVASSRGDFLTCLSDFASMEILGQRHNCSAGEELLELIRSYIDAASDNSLSAANDELLSVYLQLALEYQQAELNDLAEKNFRIGFSLIDTIVKMTLEADPRKQMRLNYLRAEFVREYGLFLQGQNRHQEALSLQNKI
ncbi:MAG TPA: hypothetical protein V6C89_03420 [Drouetiella sp.]|jgi:hypothetical protein